MSRRYLFRHHCPYLNSLHTIAVDYAKIDLLGDLKTYYKATGYSCDYVDECPYPAEDDYGRRPVFLAAPDEPV